MMVIVEFLLSRSVGFYATFGYLLVFILLFLESLPFIGAFIPGGILVLFLGGFIAKLGFMNIWVMMGVQEFNFGNEIQIAGIDYVEEVLRETFEVRDNDDNKIMVLDSFGNANIKGNLTQNVFIDADENDFVIQDTPDSVVVITNPEGNMNIKGSLNENQSVLLPTQDSLVIENKNGEVVAYVNSSGSLFLKGTFTENVLFG